MNEPMTINESIMYLFLVGAVALYRHHGFWQATRLVLGLVWPVQAIAPKKERLTPCSRQNLRVTMNQNCGILAFVLFYQNGAEW